SFEAWPSQAAFDADVAEFGDGWDHVSRGAVSAATNLDNCLSLQVERDPRPTNFVHNLTVTTWQAMVSKSFQVSGPRVGQNANDRAVVGLANHFVVPTTNRITRMAGRASVDRRGSVGGVLRNVRRDVEVAQIVDELAHIVSLVGAKRHAAS